MYIRVYDSTSVPRYLYIEYGTDNPSDNPVPNVKKKIYYDFFLSLHDRCFFFLILRINYYNISYLNYIKYSYIRIIYMYADIYIFIIYIII